MPKSEPDYRPDINSADREALRRVDAIDDDAVDAILKIREREGRIAGPEDLARLPEISEQQAEAIGRQVEFL